VFPEDGTPLPKYSADTSLISIYYCAFWWGDLRERDHLGDRDVDGRIIIRRFFRKCDVGAWIGPTWFSIGAAEGHL